MSRSQAASAPGRPVMVAENKGILAGMFPTPHVPSVNSIRVYNIVFYTRVVPELKHHLSP